MGFKQDSSYWLCVKILKKLAIIKILLELVLVADLYLKNNVVIAI